MSMVTQDAEVEKILRSVGDNGRYQKLLMWLFMVPLNFIIPWTALVQVFQTSVPDHWCHVPGRPENVSADLWKRLTIPKTGENGDFSKCEQYSSFPDFRNFEAKNYSGVTLACKHGWEYDRTWYDKTLATERNWVCERDSYSARWLSAGIFGNVIGTLIYSCLADYWGRKIGIILSTQTYAVFAIIRLYVTTASGDLILMFLSSMSFAANLEISLIWVMEQVSADMRALVTSVSFVMWTGGMSLLPLIAWLTRDWQLLGIVTAVPFIPFTAIWWIFPESPRWLLSRGRTEDALKAFERIAKYNKTKVPADLHNTLQKLASNVPSENTSIFSSLSFIELLRGTVVRKRLLLITLCYVCNNAMYYGIILNTANISGNEFLNFFYLSISELPGNIVAWYSAQNFGRKFSELGFFLLATLTAVVAVCIADTDSWVEIMVLVICKTLVNISFLVIYIQAAEILPTSHRSAGTGFASIVASIVGISAPYIAYSGSHWSALPYMILVLIGITGTIGALFLPETMGEHLPQTVTEANVHLIDQPLWCYKGWRPKWFNKRADTTPMEIRKVVM